MNTAQIKRFAQQARNILKKGVYTRLLMHGYNSKTRQVETEIQEISGGVVIDGKLIRDPLYAKQWNSLKKAIRTHGADAVAEEAAYTWFNRLMAIRILAKNGYIAPQLEYVSDTFQTTMIVSNTHRGFHEKMDSASQEYLEELLQDDSRETELFTLLICRYCRESELLNRLFGRINDYTELLLPMDILAENGFIHLLNSSDAISDEDYQEVELIGWLYQFYISEKKDEVFASFKKNKKAEAEDIPAATQIFTPNWIVKYMVENTVGQLWLDLHPRDALRSEMHYLVENPDARSAPIIAEVADIQLLDPAAGSGHILVEGFDLLYRMYRTEGYTAREAVENILRQNLFGLDIDLRAVQLARFALLLKAANYYPEILKTDILPHIYAMPEADEFTPDEISQFLGSEAQAYQVEFTEALELMQQAKNLGSVMKLSLTPEAREFIQKRVAEPPASRNLFNVQLWDRLTPFIDVLLVLTRKYNAVAANPPYMGGKNMNGGLKKYIASNYPDSKSDLFAVFMEVCLDLCEEDGLMGMINMHSWMFLSSFEKLRKNIIDNYTIDTMLHLGARTFDELSGEVVQNTAFMLKNREPEASKGVYYRLVDGENSTAKKELFLSDINRYPHIPQSNFEKIPGSPIAYWVSEKVVEIFESYKPLSYYSSPRKGNSTSNNDRFLRFWTEININKMGVGYFSVSKFLSDGKRWLPYNKGGGIRKWYGYNSYLIDWKDDAKEIRAIPSAVITNEKYYMKPGLTWSTVSSVSFAVRYFEEGFIFDNGGCCLFNIRQTRNYLAALLNSKIVDYILSQINPTLNYQSGDIAKLPIIINNIDEDIPLSCRKISKTDWDSRETSWDFEVNPLVAQQATSIEEAYRLWCEAVTKDFFTLHKNEEELNRIFIDIYGLQDELTPDVALRDITILQEEIKNDDLDDIEPAFRAGSNEKVALPIQRKVVAAQLVSYLVGVAMGRYRLDKPGLHIAHPSPTPEETVSYNFNGGTFQMEEDAVMPLMAEDCGFADNTLVRVKELLTLIWGEEQLIPTLNFLHDALGKSLEDYLRDDFWPEHVRRYQKRPIYWLFSSGKRKPAFQVLTYMHRMNRHTVEIIRSRYLLRYIGTLESRVASLKARDAELNNQERRLLEKLERDLYECREYEMKLKTIADKQIEFDLDDGVKVNYAKFEDVVRKI